MNSSSISNLIPRAPRYVIKLNDEQFVRFAKEQETEELYSSTLLNISASGLAFATHRDCQIEIGEKIKIEFPIPGFRTVAWWAKIVRLDSYTKPNWFREPAFPAKDEILVAVEFYQMPVKHQDLISKELEKKKKALYKKRKRMFYIKLIKTVKTHTLRILLFITFALLTFYLLHSLSRLSLSH